MADHHRTGEPRWDHAPLDETMHDARMLSVSVLDRCARDGWEQLARLVGVPRRRWRRHHPLAGGGPLVALVDGQPATDASAWERFVSLVPGAVALPTRTAAAFSVARGALRPPGRRSRFVDLLAARRRRRRLRRAAVTLDADHALHRARIGAACDDALAPGDDGAPLEQLPAYALAARIEELLRAAGRQSLPVLVDQLAVEATTTLVQLLRLRGREPGRALLEAVQLQSGGGVETPPHLEALAAAALADGDERARLLAAWRAGIDGWFAMRELPLEAPPLRDARDEDLLALAAAGRHAGVEPRDSQDAAQGTDAEAREANLAEAAARARRYAAVREAVAHDRARVHAALRALTWSLATALERDGRIATADELFDRPLDEVLRIARGAEPAAPSAEVDAAPPGESAPTSIAARTRVELRGIPASEGRASGRVVVLDDPAPGADVEGAVVVCRSADPAWMPLLLRAAALVTERSGPLSRTAYLARELGLPAVVVVRGAVDAARGAGTGSVDGASGAVTFEPAATR